MIEVTIDPPTGEAERRALMFDPRFHDADRLVGALQPAMLDHRGLNALGEHIQRHVQASDALQRYALNLWRATVAPQEFGIRLPEVDTAELMLAGASPRGMSMLLRAARVAAWLDGRTHVTPEDVQAVFVEAQGEKKVDVDSNDCMSVR